MFKTISRTIILLIVFMFGSVVAASASVTDIDNQTEAGDYQDWNKRSTFHYYLKTYFGKWNSNWYDHYYQKDTNNKKPVEENNNVQEKPQQEQQETTKPNVENKEPTVENKPGKQETTDALNNFEQQVVDLTNQERTKAGLAPLKADYELNRVAREKSRDMSINNYFSHNSPVYGSPFDMMRSYGINYRAAGENIAKGQRSPQEVVQAWMNSPGHRANILNGSFTHIGVGYVEKGNHWTQMFIGK